MVQSLSVYDLYFSSDGLNMQFFVSIATEECIDIATKIFRLFGLRSSYCCSIKKPSIRNADNDV